jgi:hypothetical protein
MNISPFRPKAVYNSVTQTAAERVFEEGEMLRREDFTFLAVLLIAGTAWAADPPARCEAAKLKEAGKYGFCRLKAESKYAKTGDAARYAADLARCDTKYSEKWQKVEGTVGSFCPTTGDEAGIESQVVADADWLALKLNGVRFVDNGDGTITDTQTGLMWEKKVAGSSCLHCVEDRYPWEPGWWGGGSPSMFDWLSELNGLTRDPSTQTGFAGYNDWRIPNIVELLTILDCGFGPPCIDPIFGPTGSSFYWSSSSGADSPLEAWYVFFGLGDVHRLFKNSDLYVRAVRGGL